MRRTFDNRAEKRIHMMLARQVRCRHLWREPFDEAAGGASYVL